MSTSHPINSDILDEQSKPPLIETFGVLVGTPPNQEIFTVQRDLLMRRSEFFETLRSARWTKSSESQKSVDLTKEDPDVFRGYLHCVYSDQVTPVPRMENGVQRYDNLIELYVLADKLLDVTTANLVIDTIISCIHETMQLPGINDIHLVYETTIEGSPLRRLLVDYCVYSEAERLSGPKDDYPYEYFQEALTEFMAMKEPLKNSYRPAPDFTLPYHRYH